MTEIDKENTTQEAPTGDGAFLSAKQLAELCGRLEQATTTLKQLSGVFVLLQHTDEGDQRISYERRFRDIIAAMNAVGEMVGEGIDDAFGDVVEVFYELEQCRTKLSGERDGECLTNQKRQAFNRNGSGERDSVFLSNHNQIRLRGNMKQRTKTVGNANE